MEPKKALHECKFNNHFSHNRTKEYGHFVYLLQCHGKHTGRKHLEFQLSHTRISSFSLTFLLTDVLIGCQSLVLAPHNHRIRSRKSIITECSMIYARSSLYIKGRLNSEIPVGILSSPQYTESVRSLSCKQDKANTAVWRKKESN